MRYDLICDLWHYYGYPDLPCPVSFQFGTKMLPTSIILLFIWKFNQVQCQVDCESLRNCQQCIHAPSCGWYLEYRSTNGSGCFKKDYLNRIKTDSSNGYSHPPQPSFHILKNENDSVITPQEVSLNLRLNEPFTFLMTITSWGKSIALKHNHKKPEVINLTFFSNCGNQFDEPIETNKCDNVQFGTAVEFLVKVEQLKCSKRQPGRIRRIEISTIPVSAILRLNLYPYCYCPCEMGGRRANPEPPEVIPDCHHRGTFICGVCYCNEGYAGKNCEENTSNTIE